MRQLQQGFGVIGVLVVLVVLGAVGGSGYVVYKNNQAAPESQVSTTESAAQNAEKGESGSNPTEAKASLKVEERKYSTVPAELQAAILQKTKEKAPGCVSGNTIVDYSGNPEDKDVKYRADGFASVGIGCDGGAKNIFAKSDGTWKWVTSANGTFQCTPLQEFKVPAAFGIDKCTTGLGDGTGEIITYSQE